MTSGRVVLLGASGFVGSSVLHRLAGRPGRLRAVARRPVAVPADAVAEIEVCSADLTEPGRMASVIADADVVVHCVAYIAGSTTWRIADGDSGAERVTVGLVRDLVDALGERRRAGGSAPCVVFVGAASQVGPSEVEVIDESRPDRPTGEYDRQKLAAESVLLAADRTGDLRGISVRLPTVYGTAASPTAEDRGVVSTMVRRAVAGEPITMWHDGTVRRDLLHVEDAARAVVAAVDHSAELTGRAWLVGSGDGRPLGEVFGTVAELVAERTGTPPVPVVTVPAPDHAEVADFRSVTIDSSAFRSRTDWRPRITVRDGLRATVAAAVGHRPDAATGRPLVGATPADVDR